MRVYTLFSALLAVLAACHEQELPGYDAAVPPFAILVTPGEVKLDLAHDQVVEQAYRAVAYYGQAPALDGGQGDAGVPPGGIEVTDQVAWSVETPSMGRFVGSTFRTEIDEQGQVVPARHGGVTRVLAELQGTTGAAQLTVFYTKHFFGPKAPPDAATKFGGATVAGRAPKILYPHDGTLFPPNLGKLEIQWAKGSGNDLFEVQISSKVLDLRLYTVEDAFELDAAAWQAMALGNRESEVTVVVRGTAVGNTAQKGVSPNIKLGFSGANVKGGLYYWVVSQSDGIYRYNFDTPTAPAEPYYTAEHANDCIGCHAVSRGGDKVAFTKSGGNGNTAILDTQTRVPIIDSKYRGNIQTFSPAGTEVIVAHMGALTRRSVATGDEVETLPTGPGKATHPDWSADGTAVTFVRVADADYTDDVHFTNGSVMVITQEGSSWSAPQELVKGGGGVNNYYPTFSPEGDWILFNRSTGDSYSDEDANLYIVKPSGGAPIALARLNGTKLSNSWPRWSPFIQAHKGATIYWLTFSSVRDYGIKLLNSGITVYEDKVPQIWMAAFDLELAAAGKDPTTAPFWLPFQDIADHNHIAQWTEKVVSIK